MLVRPIIISDVLRSTHEGMILEEDIHRIGLDSASIALAEEKLRVFFEANLDDIILPLGRPYLRYAPVLSVINEVFQGNLYGAKVVEVGTGAAGIGLLGYLMAQGADVLGIDKTMSHEKFAKRVKVPFAPGLKWENLQTGLKNRDYGTADVIVTCSMTPKVAESSPLIGRFGYDMAKLVSRCLTPNGIYLNHFIRESDFWFSPQFFIPEGFSCYGAKTNNERSMEIYQRNGS